MAFEWMKNIASPLEALKPFSLDHQSFEAGDRVHWVDLCWTSRRVYKLIHDGFLKDPFLKVEPEKKKKKKHGKRSSSKNNC